MTTQCTKRVFSTLRSDISGHICNRNAKVFVGNKGLCTLHSPEGQANKERKFQEKYNAQRAADTERFAKLAYDRAAGNWCRSKGMTVEDLTP